MRKFHFILVTLLAVCSAMGLASNQDRPCVPGKPDVRTYGYWKRVSEDAAYASDVEKSDAQLDCIGDTQTFAGLNDIDDVFAALNVADNASPAARAEAQFLAVLLNYCSGKVELCQCISDPVAGEITVAALIQTLDALLANPNRSKADVLKALAMAERFNSDSTLAACAPALAQMPPVTQDDFYTTNWDTRLVVPAPGLLANDTDPNGDPMQTHLWSAPSRGTLALGRDGSFTYTPVPGQSGNVTFVYKAWDGRAYTLATATITITPGNLAPICHDDFYTVDEGKRLIVPAPGVLANDSDPEGTPLVAHGTTVVPSVGRLWLNHDGSFTYQAPVGFAGNVTFVYKASDGIAKTACTVTIKINPGLPPVCRDDYYTVKAGTRLVVPPAGILANDYDPEGGSLIAHGTTTLPAVGTLGLNHDGSIWYDAPAGYTGRVNFLYRAADGTAKSGCMVYIDIVP